MLLLLTWIQKICINIFYDDGCGADTDVLLYLISWKCLQESADHSDSEDNEDGEEDERSTENETEEKKNYFEEEEEEEEEKEEEDNYSDSSDTICMSSDSETEV